MSETYQSKRERRQRILAALPSELRPHVSLRNVEAVSSLSIDAQFRLLEADVCRWQVLSAAHDLNIGDFISPDSLEVKTVFQNDNSSLYITAEEVEGVAGGIVTQPILSGQPVFRGRRYAPVG